MRLRISAVVFSAAAQASAATEDGSGFEGGSGGDGGEDAQGRSSPKTTPFTRRSPIAVVKNGHNPTRNLQSGATEKQNKPKKITAWCESSNSGAWLVFEDAKTKSERRKRREIKKKKKIMIL